MSIFPTMESRKIAVIGGGYAGIAAARKLEDAGQTVDLYEEGVLGGRVVGLRSPKTCLDLAIPILSMADLEWAKCLTQQDSADLFFPCVTA